MRNLKIASLLTRSIVVASLLMMGGCATNPVTGKKQVVLMSEAQEIALGAESDPQIIAQFGLYDNSEIQKFIEAHGQEMAAISHRPNLKFHFRILDSPVVNAFAVPGGYVYFTRGIMAHFNNEAEFAGVLGHEIGHITARHSVSQQTNATLAQVLFIGGLAVSKELRAFAREADMGMQLMFLKFGRDHESQSDKLGVEYSTKVGYDANEMADFFKTLKKLSTSEDGEEIPTFLSTHPDPADRYNKVKEYAAEWQAKYPGENFKVNGNTFLNMIDGIVYGEDPRQGFVENDIFYHPGLKFQYPVPDKWTLVNSPSQVQMAAPDGNAIMVLGLGEGSSLQEAASKANEAYKFTVTSSKEVTVNGLRALEVMSTQTQQDPNTGQQSSINIQSIYIKYGDLIYAFHGVSLSNLFQKYKSNFDKTMYGFKSLNDASKINVQPERIKVVAVKKTGTLEQALSAYDMPSQRHRELGILNGKEPGDQVTQGTQIKILVKGQMPKS